MPIYVRPSEKGKIHIQGADGSTRCWPGRYKTAEWETIVPGDSDWQNVCKGCLSTPSDPNTFYAARQEARAQESAVIRASRPTRKLDYSTPKTDVITCPDCGLPHLAKFGPCGKR